MKIKYLNLVFIFIFVQLSLHSIFATTNCFQTISGVTQDVSGGQQGEYIIRIPTQITNTDLNFVKLPNVTYCDNKTTILEIVGNNTITLNESKSNYKITGIDRILIKNNGSLTFNIDNLDNVVQLTTIDINTDIYLSNNTNSKLLFLEAERSWADNDAYRRAHGIKVKLKNLFVGFNSDLNLSLISRTPNNRSDSTTSGPYVGTPGGPSILDINSIINSSNMNINLVGGNGAKGSTGKTDSPRKAGGDGGTGGDSNLILKYLELIDNSELNLILISGNGGDGGSGASEGGGPRCSGDPKAGGSGAISGSVVFDISKIKLNNSNFYITLNSGNGGNGGDAGANHCRNDNADGGIGGSTGKIILRNNDLINNGSIMWNIIAGNGGNGGDNAHDGGGTDGYGGNGGLISDLNITKFINNGDFNYYSVSGKKGFNSSYPTEPSYFGTAGSIGSINVDYLFNKSGNINIKTELNEDNIDSITAVNCSCTTEACGGEDPTIGDINIKYLASGSYLPKKLEIVKHVPINFSNINIKSCYLKSLGNSQLSYITDNLSLEATNLGDIASDFDNNTNQVPNALFNLVYCPVCDGLELDNPLRIDKEYTIYSTISSNITDLNIYYLTPDGNLFRPPGFPTDQNYIVYSLKPGEIISVSDSFTFGQDIKEFKISKNKLIYIPEQLNLEDISNVKLFCPGQRYLIVYKQSEIIKQIEFTPLFNIR